MTPDTRRIILERLATREGCTRAWIMERTGFTIAQANQFLKDQGARKVRGGAFTTTTKCRVIASPFDIMPAATSPIRPGG